MTIEIPEQFSPNRLYVCTQDGHVARMSTDGGDPVDISPTSAQRADIGNVIRMITDPFNAKRAIILGAGGICWTNDVTAAPVTWQSPGIQSVAATFDTGSYASTITAGSVVSGGNPDSCLGDENKSSSAQAAARLTFPSPVKVLSVAMDYKKNHTGNIARDCYLYDADNAELDHPIDQDSEPTNNTWFTETASGLSVPGVRSALFQVSAAVSLPDCTPAFYDFRTGWGPWERLIGLYVAGEGIQAENDGYENMTFVRMMCSEHLAYGSRIRASWYMDYWETHGDIYTIYLYDSSWGQLGGSLYTTAIGPGEVSFTYGPIYRSDVYGIGWRGWAGYSATPCILRSIEIIAP